MDVLFEQNVVQNIGLSAECIFVAVSEYHKKKDLRAGLEFPLVFLILPLVFHQATVGVIKKMKGSGLLFKAIRKNREIPLGIQERMESMYRRTLDACSLAFDAQLLVYDDSTAQLLPARKALPDAFSHTSIEVTDILKAAKRVGVALCEHSIEEIARLLEVVF